jgi:predicted PurR-regulated permease PerM
MKQPRTPDPRRPAATASAEPSTGVLTRDRLKSFCLFLITALAVWLCYRMAQPFLPALTWGAALAVIGRKGHHWVFARCPWPSLAAGLSVALVTLLLAAPVAFLSYHLTAQAGAYAARMDELKTEPVQALIDGNERLRPAVRWLRENVDVERELMTAVSQASRQVPSVVTGTAWMVMQTLIMLLVLFYFFRDEPEVLQSVRRMMPLSMAESELLFARVDDTIHATIFGSLVIAAIQGAMGGLMFRWLGLPTPLLWGIVMGLLAVIPNLGTFVVWGPAAALLALQGDYGKAGLLAGWGLVAIGLIDNLIYPILVGNRIRLHPLIVFFAVLGGLTVFGASGVVLGPGLVAVLAALFDIWRRRTVGGDSADDPQTLDARTSTEEKPKTIERRDAEKASPKP